MALYYLVHICVQAVIKYLPSATHLRCGEIFLFCFRNLPLKQTVISLKAFDNQPACDKITAKSIMTPLFRMQYNRKRQTVARSTTNKSLKSRNLSSHIDLGIHAFDNRVTLTFYLLTSGSMHAEVMR